MNRLRAIWARLKTWQKVVVIFLALGVLRGMLSTGEQRAASPPKPTVATPEAPKQANEEPVTFSDQDITKESVEKHSGLQGITQVSITPVDDNGTKHILVAYDFGQQWDETHALKEFNRKTLGAFHSLFANPKVFSIRIEGETNFLDKYGKESKGTAMWIEWRRDAADKVDWKNFEGLVLIQPQREFQLAYAYGIHPGVYQKLEEKVKTGLPITGHQ